VTDHATYVSGYVGGSGGPGVQSRVGLFNRVGYAGYQWDHIVQGDHVRHRVYLPGYGRWTRRDPAGYVDGSSLVCYLAMHPLNATDPLGLVSSTCCNDPFCCYSRRQQEQISHVLALAHCWAPDYVSALLAAAACASACVWLQQPAAVLACFAACEYLVGVTGDLLDYLINGSPTCWQQYRRDQYNSDFAYCQCLGAKRRFCQGMPGEPELMPPVIPCGTGGLPPIVAPPGWKPRTGGDPVPSRPIIPLPQ
jgi:RHS repeat-associated protein